MLINIQVCDRQPDPRPVWRPAQAVDTVQISADYADKQAHHDLLRGLRGGPIANAGYFGCGPDTEWLMLVSNPDHMWMFDRIPLVARPNPKNLSSESYLAAMPTGQQVDYLRDALDRGDIKPYRHGFFRYEDEHRDTLGAKLLGNLTQCGAADIRMQMFNCHRVDFHFQWAHPTDRDPRPRSLSFVWCEGKAGEDSLPEVGAPPLQFLMTRGLNNSGNQIPVLRQLADRMEVGGVAFVDFDWKHPAMQAQIVDSGKWSQHGSLHAYEKI